MGKTGNDRENSFMDVDYESKIKTEKTPAAYLAGTLMMSAFYELALFKGDRYYIRDIS